MLIQGRLLVGFIYPVMGNPMSFQGEFQSCGGGILSDCYLGSFFFLHYLLNIIIVIIIALFTKTLYTERKRILKLIIKIFIFIYMKFEKKKILIDY